MAVRALVPPHPGLPRRPARPRLHSDLPRRFLGYAAAPAAIGRRRRGGRTRLRSGRAGTDLASRVNGLPEDLDPALDLVDRRVAVLQTKEVLERRILGEPLSGSAVDAGLEAVPLHLRPVDVVRELQPEVERALRDVEADG